MSTKEHIGHLIGQIDRAIMVLERLFAVLPRHLTEA
jgi:hypothetical protein